MTACICGGNCGDQLIVVCLDCKESTRISYKDSYEMQKQHMRHAVITQHIGTRNTGA